MTPEEQFTKIENSLRHAAEIQAQHEEIFRRHAESLARHAENLDRNDIQIEKNSAGIRDLIVVSRTLVDSQGSLVDSQRLVDEKLAALAEAQRQSTEDFTVQLNALLQAQTETEHKLQRWIDRQGNGHA